MTPTTGSTTATTSITMYLYTFIIIRKIQNKKYKNIKFDKYSTGENFGPSSALIEYVALGDFNCTNIQHISDTRY
jgi:hypothetical protein